jgi:hypothetical protein
MFGRLERALHGAFVRAGALVVHGEEAPASASPVAQDAEADPGTMHASARMGLGESVSRR